MQPPHRSFRHPRSPGSPDSNELLSSFRAQLGACDVKETVDRDYRVGIIDGKKFDIMTPTRR